jgi:cell division control protein 6
MTINYFDDLLRKPTLFKDESKLDINYIPERLPHREKELSLLSQLFLALLTNPNSISRKILITGKTGIGKTVTVKLFGKMLMETAIKRKVQIMYIHINCRKERTSYKVLIKIIRTINKNFPKRGYSPQDLIEVILDLLKSRDLHLLIILDELSYLINTDGDLIYSLTRLNDDTINAPQRLSLIGIVRDISCLNSLDTSTLSTLQRNIIKFNYYSKKQIFNIFKYRAEESLKENVISDNLLNSIADIVLKNGDIRYGLNLLWRTCKIAESKNLLHITVDCIRLGNQETIPFLTQDVLKYLSVQKLLFLLSIVISLKKSKTSLISINDVLKSYYMLGENTGIKVRSYSQLWNYLQEFKKENILSIKILSEKIKGRKSLIEISDIPLPILEDYLLKILNSRGIKL